MTRHGIIRLRLERADRFGGTHDRPTEALVPERHDDEVGPDEAGTTVTATAVVGGEVGLDVDVAQDPLEIVRVVHGVIVTRDASRRRVHPRRLRNSDEVEPLERVGRR